MVKPRLYNEDTAAAWTIHRIVRDLMAVFSPVCPFFTHHITSTIYSSSAVDRREFPKVPVPELADGTSENSRLLSLTPILEEFNSMVWRTKKEAGMSLASPLDGVEIPVELEEFNTALSQMHKL